MKKAVTLFFFALLILSSAFSNTENIKTVKVGYYENEVFQEGAAPGAIKKGYSYEYYRKLSEYTGWKYEYVYGSFSDLYDKLLNGQIDLLAGLAYKPERANLIFYPEAAMGNETYSLIKHDSDLSITANYQSLNGKTIGVLNSAIYDVLNKFLVSHNIKAEIKKYDAYDLLFEAFDSRAIDILAAEGDGAYGREHAEVICAFGASDYFLCVAKNRNDLLIELNSAQTQLFTEEPNFVSSLKSKFYPVSVSSRSISQAEKNWIENHSKLRIGYLNSYLPYSDTSPQKIPDGMIIEIIPQIINSLGISNLETFYEGFQSYDEMIKAMLDEKVDAIFPVGGGFYYSEENGIYQSNAVVSSSTALVFLSEFDSNKHNTFAVNKNNKMQYYYIINNFPESNIVYYSSIEECLNAVLKGNADCTTINGLRNDILKNRRYRSLSSIPLKNPDDRSFGIEIGNEGLLKLLNRGISIIGSEYFQNLSYNYAQKLYKYTILDMIQDNIFIFGSIFVIIVALIIFLLVRDSKHSKAALNAAQNANHAKTVFLTNMSHDIRTPMNAIVGFTELARQNIQNEKLIDDYLSKISVSSQHLLSLINDVLDMSRIESGNDILEEENVNLSSLIDDLRIIILPDIDQKKQSFTVNISDIKHPDIIADKLRLNKILLNIISNAIKFTPMEGHISLIVKELSSQDEISKKSIYEFRIKDNGIGMSTEFQKIIFDSFTRERNSTVSGIQGTGLGMAITKNIVDLFKGNIKVNSTEGQGSEFIVTIPFKICDAPKAVKQIEINPIDFTGKRILLVEDIEMNQQLVIMMLKMYGIEVELAVDGSFAVSMFCKKPSGYYDLILMDIQMPNMNGYEATKQIRALEKSNGTHIPIFAMTANAFKEDKTKALEAGMDGHISKPIDRELLIKTLNDAFKTDTD